MSVAGLDNHPVYGKKGHGPVPVDPADLGPWMKALLKAIELKALAVG